MPSWFMSPVFIVFAVVFMNVVFVIAMAKRYVKVGPNEALVVSGGQHGTRIVVGGGTLVWPIIEQAASLPLEMLDGEMRIPGLRAGGGEPLDLVATLGVKIGRDEAALRAAAGHFLSKSREEILRIALRVVETRVRETAAVMAPEAVAGSLDALARDARAEAAAALGTMGLTMDVFTLRSARQTAA
jgi:flotillin